MRPYGRIRRHALAVGWKGEAKDKLGTLDIAQVAAGHAAEAERFVEAVGDVLVRAAPEDDRLGTGRTGDGQATLREGTADPPAAGERGVARRESSASPSLGTSRPAPGG